MAKKFNLSLFFKKNKTVLLVVGIVLIALFFFGVNADIMDAIQIFRKGPEEVKQGGCQLVEGFDESMWVDLPHEDKLSYCGLTSMTSDEWNVIHGSPVDMTQLSIIGNWCNENPNVNVKTLQDIKYSNEETRCKLENGSWGTPEQCRGLGRGLGEQYRELNEKISEQKRKVNTGK